MVFFFSSVYTVMIFYNPEISSLGIPDRIFCRILAFAASICALRDFFVHCGYSLTS